MSDIGLIAIASALDIFCSIVLLFICYWVNLTTMKNVAQSHRNIETTQMVLAIVQQCQNKCEAERANQSV